MPSKIVVSFIDVHQLHDFKEESSINFIVALSELENYEVFDSKVVQNIILFQYGLVKEYTIKLLFYPFLVHLLSYFLYSDFLLPGLAEADLAQNTTLAGWYHVPVIIFQGINLAFCVYFLANEAK